jgi:putative acetyltransferase
VVIRRERPADADAIRAVHRAAFADPERDHGKLVDELRADGNAVLALSLVAEVDAVVVGHVACSYGTPPGARLKPRPASGRGTGPPMACPP